MTAPPSTPSPWRLAALGALAALLHGGFDAACSAAGATPPYLRLADAPEVFQLVSPLAVSVAASAVSGINAAIALVVTIEVRRPGPLPVGAAIAAFWILSAGMARLVWFDTPVGPTLVSIACGIPRGLAIGWVLARACADAQGRRETIGVARRGGTPPRA